MNNTKNEYEPIEFWPRLHVQQYISSEIKNLAKNDEKSKTIRHKKCRKNN